MNHISIVFGHISLLSAERCHFFSGTDFSGDGFINLHPLILMLFKRMDVTLKYARFLKIGILALYHERTILIVLKFQDTHPIGSRPVKLKPISRSILSECYTVFISYNCIV